MKRNLTEPMKTACVAILKEGRASLFNPGKFKTPAGSTIKIVSAIAMCDRSLAQIVVESRHRKYQFLELTDIGQMVALQIIAERTKPSDIDAWQDDGEVYPADRDVEYRPSDMREVIE